MKHKSVGTYHYRITVHPYLYRYVYLHVQCNTVAVTVGPLNKKEVKEAFCTPPKDLKLEVSVSKGALVKNVKQTTLTRHDSLYRQLIENLKVDTWLDWTTEICHSRSLPTWVRPLRPPLHVAASF